MQVHPALGIAVVTATLLVVPLAASGAVSGGNPSGPADGGLHGNHVIVGPQISADGTVIAEEAATLATGFVVLRRDDGGQPGQPLGHTRLQGTTIRTDVPITVDDGVWADWSGARTLWAVVHLDDGDGAFDLGSDPSAAGRYRSAKQSFTLARSDTPVRILARQTDPVDLRNGTLTVRQVALATDGHVVAHPLDGDRVVGARALPAGTHENATLELDEAFLAEQDPRFRLRLAVYRDDGDGEFDGDDRPVRVGDERVETDLVVRRVDEDATPTEPFIVTPSPTATPDSSIAAGTGSTGGGGSAGEAPRERTATDGAGAGFGITLVLVVVAILGAVGILARNRR